jgi:hypothetical protein
MGLRLWSIRRLPSSIRLRWSLPRDPFIILAGGVVTAVLGTDGPPTTGTAVTVGTADTGIAKCGLAAAPSSGSESRFRFGSQAPQALLHGGPALLFGVFNGPAVLNLIKGRVAPAADRPSRA